MGEKGMMMGKRGQVTIFIIIAIIIVAAGFLIYSFYPQIKSTLSGQEVTPESYIQSCVEGEIKTAVDTLSVQGGTIKPENFLLYKDTKVEYLCYTAEYYSPCIVQQPMLKTHVELEIQNDIKNTVDACFASMKSSYEKKGFSVDLKSGQKRIELLPKRIVATFNYSLTLTKGSDTQKHDSFSVVMNNNLYELISIANSIIEFETTYGDAETTAYMVYYHDLKVEKNLQSSGVKVYVLTDRNTENKFQFASRGQVWPAGYVNPLGA
jgi:hypothetical protein